MNITEIPGKIWKKIPEGLEIWIIGGAIGLIILLIFMPGIVYLGLVGLLIWYARKQPWFKKWNEPTKQKKNKTIKERIKEVLK